MLVYNARRHRELTGPIEHVRHSGDRWIVVVSEEEMPRRRCNIVGGLEIPFERSARARTARACRPLDRRQRVPRSG